MDRSKIKPALIIISILILLLGIESGLSDVTSSGATTNSQTSTSGSQTAITGGYNSDVTTTYSSGSSNTTNNTTSNSTSNEAKSNPVSMSSAPSMSSYGQDSCLIPLAAGVSVMTISATAGSYIVDKNCERRKATSVLAKLGMKVAAISLMCQDENVWNAMKSAGSVCPIDGLISEQAEKRWEEVGGFHRTKEYAHKGSSSKETNDKVEQYRKYKESLNEDHSNHNHD